MLEKNIRRYKLMDTHRKLVRAGKYLEARLMLELLRNGRVILGLSDVEWNVGALCDRLGCPSRYSGSGYTAEVRL